MIRSASLRILLLMLLAVFLQGSVAMADVNVLIVGSSQNFSSAPNSTSVAFTPTGVATQLRSILEGVAGVGTVNVTLEDRAAHSGIAWDNTLRWEQPPYKSYGYVIDVGPGNPGQTPHTLAQWFHYPYLPKTGKWEVNYEFAKRWPNLRGELATAWDYVILIGDPHTMEYLPGIYAHGVAMIGEEVAKGSAETVLLMPWPGAGSDSTVAHYKNVVYRAGRSGGYKVAPAGLAWEAAGSPTTAAMHPNDDGAYIAAASIYSRLWNQNANQSSYTYGDGSLADTVYTTVTNAIGAPQYTGKFEFQKPFNPFKMDFIKERKFRPIHNGASHHQGYTDGAIRASWRCNVDGNQNVGPVAWHLGMGAGASSTNLYNFQPNHSAPMAFGYERQAFYAEAVNYNTVGNPDAGHIAMMNDSEIHHMRAELADANAMRSLSAKSRMSLHRFLWAQVHKEFPLENILGDWQHFDKVAEDAAGTYMFTLYSGRCSVDPQPDPITARWFAQKVGYETAWRVSHCVSRAPGFRVVASAKNKYTITHDAPETLSVQFINPPQENVTVNVSLSNESAALVSHRTLTFTPQNYNVAQQVVVTPLRGSTASAAVNVEFSTVSNDVVYDGLDDSWDYTVVRDVEAITQVNNGVTTAQTIQNTPVTIDLNAAGANANSTLFVGPGHGSIAWTSSGVIQYTPATDYIGADWIAYASTVNGVQTKGYVSISVAAPVGQVVVSVADGVASEQGPNLGSFTISRLGSTVGALDLYFTMGGTATAGSDYTINATSSVTIPDGQSSVTVTVTPIDDGVVEGTETVTLSLTANAGYEIGVTSATFSIEDNDAPIITTSPWADVDPILDSATASLHVVASHAGGAPLTYTWSKVYGYGAVDFSPNGTGASNNTTASFTSLGFYVLKVTVSDGTTSVSDNVSIRVLHDASNLLSPVVYESFDLPTAGVLTGQPVTGFGLSGTWSYGTSTPFNVEAGGLSYGGLPVAGNLHTSFAGRRRGANATLESGVLSNAGLLDHGKTLWFSVLHKIAPGNHTQASGSFALGSGGLSYGLPPGTANGVGFWIEKGDILHAVVWNPGLNTSTSVDLAPTGAEFGNTVLIVGKVTWGVDGASNDTVELYLPDASLNLGPVVATAFAPINQSTIANVTFGGTLENANECQDFDEVRVGGSFVSVVGQLGAEPRAGADQLVFDNDDNGSESITLDGTASYGDIVSYEWTEGATQIATGINPTVDLAVGTHNITLTVTDIRAKTFTDTVIVRVRPPNTLPSFNAGANVAYDLTLPAGWSPAGWSPAELSPIAWYDASDTNTITASNGAVSKWADKSVNGNDWNQTNAAVQPQTGGSINSRNSIVFYGDFMQSTSQLTNVRSAIFVTDNLRGSAESSSYSGFFRSPSGDLSQYGNTYIDRGSNGNAALNGGALSYGGSIPAVPGLSSTTKIAPLMWYVDWDAIQAIDYLGKSISDTAWFLRGEFGEIILLNNVPTAAERQIAEGYIAHKWGFEAKLPDGHPYKVAPYGTPYAVVDLNATLGADPDGDAVTKSWSVTSAPAGAPVIFGDTSQLNTTVTFYQPGVYTLRLTVNDGFSTGFSEIVITLAMPAAADYASWSGNYTGTDLSDPNADADGDGQSNHFERVFGLNPTSSGSSNPISVPLDTATGTFNYTRRNPSLTGLNYTVWYSSDLSTWDQDTGAQQTAGTAGSDGVQSVVVTMSSALMENPSLFIRIKAQ